MGHYFGRYFGIFKWYYSLLHDKTIMSNSKIEKTTNLNQVLIRKLPTELRLNILKRLRKEDLKAILKANASVSKNASNAYRTLKENTPKMTSLLTKLIYLIAKNFSSQTNISNIKITKLKIEGKTIDRKTKFTIIYDNDFQYKNNNSSMNNTADYKKNTISLSRISFLINESFYHPAQFHTDEEREEYEDMMRKSVIEEYAEQYANFLDDVLAFDISELKMENFKCNGCTNSSNAQKINAVKKEINNSLTNLL